MITSKQGSTLANPSEGVCWALCQRMPAWGPLLLIAPHTLETGSCSPLHNTDETKIPGLIQMAFDTLFPRAFFIKTQKRGQILILSVFFLAVQFIMWESQFPD